MHRASEALKVSARLGSHLELVDLPLGLVVYESGATQVHIYFPTTAIVSLLYVMQDGAPAEIAVVGNEDTIGIALFMGGLTTTSRFAAGYSCASIGCPRTN